MGNVETVNVLFNVGAQLSKPDPIFAPMPMRKYRRRAIAAAQSEDAVKIDVLNDIQPLQGTGGYGTVLRSLHTPFMDEWGTKREEARRERERLWADIAARAQAG